MQAQQLNRTYVSSINFMDQREILGQVLDLYDEMDTIVDVMMETGRFVVSDQETFYYHVNERLHKAATSAGILAQPAAGAASTVALTAGSVKPRVGDIMLTPGRYRSLVTAVSGNDVTVKPLNDASIAHEALTATTKLTFFSNAYAEGTDVNGGYIYGTSLYSNNIQIIKGEFSVTDLQAMTKVEVEFEGKNYYFIKGQADAFNRFKMDVAYAWLLGEKSNNLTDANGKKVLTTHGLEKSVRGSGINLPLATNDFATFEANFRSFNRAIDQARGPKEYWMWNGPDISNYIDDWLTQKEGLKAGGIQYNSFGASNPKQRSVDLGFDSFKIYNRTFHKKTLDALDNIELTAAAGFTYPSTMFLIPATKIKCNHSGEMKDRFRVRYLEAPQNSGVNVASSKEYYEVLTGGLAPVPTSNTMELNISYQTWQGPEFLGLEHFAVNTLS
jgi:UDP-2,3-diacylglucosamine pyrophosphatase LpxH